MARILIVGEGPCAAALSGGLAEDGHVVGATTAQPDRGALEHVTIVCWLSPVSPERFLLAAVDSSMRGFVHRAGDRGQAGGRAQDGGWERAVAEVARRNAIPVARVQADPCGDPRAWLAEAMAAVRGLLSPGPARSSAMLDVTP